MSSNTKSRTLFMNAAFVIVGVVLTVAAALGMAINALNSAEDLARGTAQTLIRQSRSFDNIQSVNRIRDLFSINENLTSLNATFQRNPETVNDEYLESYVDGMQLSGIAVLDGNLELVASAYTRDSYKENWKDDFYPGLFERMMNCSAQVYAERMVVDGQYYDVCASARTDSRGVIIAYYKKPMSLIYDTENDLKQLLKNVRMDKDGEFIIAHNGRIISEGTKVDTEEFVKSAETVLNSDGISYFNFNGNGLYGMRVVDGDYAIYLYFPFVSVFDDTFIWLLLFILLYVSFCLTGVVFKTKSDRAKRKILEENNRKLTESTRIMKSLETVYFTIFYVDLENDSYKSLILAPWLEPLIAEEGTFMATADKLIAVSVEKDYQGVHTENLDFEQIITRLKKRNDGSEISSYYADYKVRRGDKEIWCRVTLTSVDFDEDGNPKHALVMLQDVDAEKSKEVAYQAQIIKEADLAQAANRAKSTFLFNVSHDIRTPMNAILGYSDLAKRALKDQGKVEKYLDNIQISGERMLSLINEVLELARIENGKVEVKESAVKAGDGIRSCIVIVAPSPKDKDVSIGLKTNLVYPYVFVDHSHMSRIILNLLNNAIKFTGKGGSIECIVNHLESDEENCCITEVVIADNGIGISEEFLPHMFEKFERENSSTVSGIAGTGLGLGIVKRLVDLMGGTVTVESQVGKGSTFTVRVPTRIASEADAMAVDVSFRINRETVKGKRILIAEDGDMNAEILTEIIRGEGIGADRVKDGEECLQAIERVGAGYYDLILMDIQMPKKDGFAATMEIRGDPDPLIANIPIVAMTANAFPEDRLRSIEAGMNGHLSKPIDMKELFTVFEKYLNAELIRIENVKIRGYINILNGQGEYGYDDE